MPKRETTTVWRCVICERTFVKRKDADECEARGPAQYRFIKNQVVHLSAPRDEPRMAVIVSVGDDLCDPHKEPESWVVDCVGEHGQRTTEAFQSKMLAPATGVTGTCPLCHGRTTTESALFWFAKSAVEMVRCDNLAYTKCASCGVEYFTDAELREARKEVAGEVCAEK